jgi:hypothetical protein
MTLHCDVGDHDWTRPAQRGRPPKACPACKAGKLHKGGRVPSEGPRQRILEEKPPKPIKEPKPKVAKRKSRWYDVPPEPEGLVLRKPLSERASGWCTDYDPAPRAQHDKCDGDLGKTRCNCPSDCHEWN